jgi:hypothetical protein
MAGFARAFPFPDFPVAAAGVAFDPAAPVAATAGIVVDGIVFSAVVSVAGFLSAPGATDRGFFLTLVAAVSRMAAVSWVMAGSSWVGATPPLLQRFVTTPPPTAHSTKKAPAAA